MAIKLDPQREAYLLGSIRQFLAAELDAPIGDLKARQVLEFFVREVGPSVLGEAKGHSRESIHATPWNSGAEAVFIVLRSV